MIDLGDRVVPAPVVHERRWIAFIRHSPGAWHNRGLEWSYDDALRGILGRDARLYQLDPGAAPVLVARTRASG